MTSSADVKEGGGVVKASAADEELDIATGLLLGAGLDDTGSNDELVVDTN